MAEEANKTRSGCNKDNGLASWTATMLATEVYPFVTNRHTRFDAPDYNFALADLKD